MLLLNNSPGSHAGDYFIPAGDMDWQQALFIPPIPPFSIFNFQLYPQQRIRNAENGGDKSLLPLLPLFEMFFVPFFVVGHLFFQKGG